MRLAFASLSLLVAAACGSDPSPNNPTPDASEEPPPLTGEKFSISYPTMTIPAGQESTKCINARLSNTSEIKVHQMRNLLGSGSHHLIVYKDDMATEERLEPYDCEPFTGALNPSGMVSPVMITQKHEDPLTLPDRVAYTFGANQMIRLEMHYLNATEADIELTATTEFYAADPAEIDHEANILFIGSPDINLAPGQTADVQAYFSTQRAQLDMTGSKFFAITGHTHQYGTQVTVATAATSGGERTTVYNPMPFDWAEPKTQTHKPEFELPPGGGFDFKCSYTNTSNQQVGFGESANDEMCFFWAYYYPSKGSHVCVHSNEYNVDLCCPGAGEICNSLLN